MVKRVVDQKAIKNKCGDFSLYLLINTYDGMRGFVYFNVEKTSKSWRDISAYT